MSIRARIRTNRAPQYLTLADLADRWSCHPKTAGRWLRQGVSGRPALQPMILGSRILFDALEVAEWERSDGRGKPRRQAKRGAG